MKICYLLQFSKWYIDSALYPLWDGKVSISFRAE